MILVENLINILKKNKVNFFTGVPDSILKDFSNYVEGFSKKQHIISTNEGSAVSIGIGYHLATKKIPCIYLQNSGLSNAINPLISIASKEVYSIPLFLMIGWRGSPRKPDEPQHLAKGKITPSLLKLLKIDFCILRKEKDLKKLKVVIKRANLKKTVVACLIEKGTLHTKKKRENISNEKFIYRSEFIKDFLNSIPKKSKIISTTGYTSRELMEVRKKIKSTNGKDFYMVGAMGHAAMLAFGNSFFKKNNTICLDGDGSAIMHLGSLAILGNYGKKNFKYILFNNGSHESVGGQKTIASKINFEKISKGFNFKRFFISSSEKNLEKNLSRFLKLDGPSFFEIKIKNKSMKNLIRPKNLLIVKKNFLHD